MSLHRKRSVKDSRGQSLVEMALVLPMLLVVMLMITEFGRALYYYNVLAQATREGVRAAVVSSQATAVTVARNRMNEVLSRSGIRVAQVTTTVTIETNFQGTGTKVVRASAARPFNWVFRNPLPANADGTGRVSPTPFTLRAETVMKTETF